MENFIMNSDSWNLKLCAERSELEIEKVAFR